MHLPPHNELIETVK